MDLCNLCPRRIADHRHCCHSDKEEKTETSAVTTNVIKFHFSITPICQWSAHEHEPIICEKYKWGFGGTESVEWNLNESYS